SQLVMFQLESTSDLRIPKPTFNLAVTSTIINCIREGIAALIRC
ncbi:uncharacterized protein METZ01_LOCUS168995, partial [marine metagenome]